jgi:hypothetical protein
MLSEQEMQEAGQIQAGLRQRLDAARLDQTITTRERQRRMARAVLSARTGIQTLRASSAAREAAEQQAAYRRLFGIRPDRAAEDRAYRDQLAARGLSASDAAQLYDQAAARGDDLALTALAELAWAQSGDEMAGKAWHPILDAYTASSDVRGAAMDSLTALAFPDKPARMRERMALEVPQPSDLPGNIDWLASDAERDAGSRPMGMPWPQGTAPGTAAV